MEAVNSSQLAEVRFGISANSSQNHHQQNAIPDIQGHIGPQEGTSRSNQNINKFPPRERQTRAVDNPFTNKVEVVGFPKYTQAEEFRRIFSQYGEPTVESITRRCALISFSSPGEAHAAVKASQKIAIYGQVVKVFPHFDDRNVNNTNGDPPKTMKRRVMTKTLEKSKILEPDKIDLSGDFIHQLHNILTAICLTQEEVEKLNTLYNDIEEVLQLAWPGCCTVPFGSITTGLGIKTSDADCFVFIPPEHKVPGNTYVNKAKQILLKYPHIFTEIVSIPSANTPIVKFFHLPAQINCDLSFKTLLGARNSRLVSFLLQADPRLIPTSIFIKYWAKVHGFSGSGKLTNYALTMMVIFFAQQPPFSLIPSVASLQIDPVFDFIVDFWNTGFMNKRDLLPAATNRSPISEMIGSFFDYYSNFEFEKLVVCPYLGYPIEKIIFKDTEQLPREFERYKYNVMNKFASVINIKTPVCIQDPFEQSHNVGSLISNRKFTEMKAYFRHASKIYYSEIEKDYSSFLKRILFEKPADLPKKKSNYKITLPPGLFHSIQDVDWINIVRKNIVVLFEEILQMNLEDCNAPDDKSIAKKITDVFKARIIAPIWKRKQFSKFYSIRKLDFVTKETKITKEIMAVNKFESSFYVKFTILYFKKPKNVHILLKLLEGDQARFNEFHKFLYLACSWLGRLIKSTLKNGNPNSEESNNSENNDTLENERFKIDIIDSDNVENEDIDSESDSEN